MNARDYEALVLRATDVLTNLDAVNASMTRQQYEELDSIANKIGFVCNYPNKFPYLNKLYGELAVFLSMAEPTRYGYTYDVELFFSCTAAIIGEMNEMRRECYKI
jgi:hypothetical protein